MTFRIISERAKVTTACAGMEGYDAEVTVEAWDGDKFLGKFFVHANEYDGTSYTVANKSYFEYVTGLSSKNPGEIDFIEEYDDISKTKKSNFAKVFEVADRLLGDLGNC